MFRVEFVELLLLLFVLVLTALVWLVGSVKTVTAEIITLSL